MAQPTAHLGCTAQPAAPRLQACTACHCTEQHEIKSITRDYGTVKRRGKHESWEAAAGVPRRGVSQHACFISVRASGPHGEAEALGSRPPDLEVALATGCVVMLVGTPQEGPL